MDSKAPFSAEQVADNDQAAFVFLEKLNIFLYIRKASGIHLILRKSPKTNILKEFRGKLHSFEDTTILAAACRKIVRKTAGLFNDDNLKYFRAEYQDPNLDAVKLDDYTAEAFPRVDTQTHKTWLHKLANLDHFYQIPKDKRVIYFVEIPELSIDRMNEFSKSKSLPYEFSEHALDTIIKDQFSQIGQLLSDAKLWRFVEEYIVEQKPVKFIAKFAFLCCSPNLGNHVNLMGLYYSHFKKPFEQWDFYDILSNQYPSDEKLKEYKGCITPGSSVSAYDANLAWKPKMEEVYRSIHENHKHLKYLGICFGAQLFTVALGGKVEKMENFVSGLETLKMKEDFYHLPFVKTLSLKQSETLNIMQGHGDQITQLPEGAILYGSSKSCLVEAFTVGDRMFGLQGHPEYNFVTSSMLASRMKKYRGVNLEGKSYREINEHITKNVFAEQDLCQEDTLKICFNFLKSSIPSTAS